MFKKRNAQGLSITTIIIAVIGLIVVVVLVAIFTGKIGDFGEGLDDTKTCSSICTALRKTTVVNEVKTTCKTSGQYLPGKYGDVTGGTGTTGTADFVPNVCCCK